MVLVGRELWRVGAPAVQLVVVVNPLLVWCFVVVVAVAVAAAAFVLRRFRTSRRDIDHGDCFLDY